MTEDECFQWSHGYCLFYCLLNEDIHVPFHWKSIQRVPFCRLKKIQEKKKIIKEKFEKELEQRRAAGEVMEPANLLAEEKDEDLLFE